MERLIPFRSGQAFMTVPFEKLQVVELDYPTFMNRDDRPGGLDSSAPTFIFKTHIECGFGDMIIFGKTAVNFIADWSIPLVIPFVPNQNVRVLLKSIDYCQHQAVVVIKDGIAEITVTQLFYFWWKNGSNPTRIPVCNSDGSIWLMSISIDRLAQKIHKKMFVTLKEFAVVMFNGRLSEDTNHILIREPFVPKVSFWDDIVLLEYHTADLRFSVMIQNDIARSKAEVFNPSKAVMSTVIPNPMLKIGDVTEMREFSPFAIIGLSSFLRRLIENS